MKQVINSFVLLLALITAIAGCSTGSDAPPAPVNNVAFITSVSGNANLNSWTDAGGLHGLAAGNAICQARATAAGLPGTYRAWISDSTTDAYCNVIGLSGTLIGNCGGVALPLPLAGPWVRTDGTRFAPTIDILTASPWILYTPLNYDEFGNVMAATYTVAFTNSDQYGVMWSGAPYNACSDWADGTTNDWSVAVVGGEAPYTDTSWATGYGFTCDTNARLLCMQTGAGIPLPAVTTTGKKVFVTSNSYSGSLGGLVGADATCTSKANLAGLTGTYTAWLSDSGNDAKDRLISTGPWVRIDGIKVASNITELTSGLLFTSISQDELGNYVSIYAWTGTNFDGSRNLDTCNDWTDGTASFHGEFGTTNSAAVNWTQSTNMLCTSTQPIYCFED